MRVEEREMCNLFLTPRIIKNGNVIENYHSPVVVALDIFSRNIIRINAIERTLFTIVCLKSGIYCSHSVCVIM